MRATLDSLPDPLRRVPMAERLRCYGGGGGGAPVSGRPLTAGQQSALRLAARNGFVPKKLGPAVKPVDLLDYLSDGQLRRDNAPIKTP